MNITDKPTITPAGGKATQTSDLDLLLKLQKLFLAVVAIFTAVSTWFVKS